MRGTSGKNTMGVGWLRGWGVRRRCRGSFSNDQCLRELPTVTCSCIHFWIMARTVHERRVQTRSGTPPGCRSLPGEEDGMRRLFVILVLLVAGVAALGFYRGWFSVDWEKRSDGKGEITGT